MAVYDLLRKKIREKSAAFISFVACLALVPGNMLAQNFDDHNRSGRTVARDYAKNVLASCDKNAILFCYGDNDTFPLWYIQDVEGYRTDVRVINFSLIGFDWNIEQMARKSFLSDPVPFSIAPEKYVDGRREWIYFTGSGFILLKDALDSIASEDPDRKLFDNGEIYDLCPSNNFIVPVDKSTALRNIYIPEELRDRIAGEIRFTVNKQAIMKSDLFLLDVVANHNWARPIHFSSGGGRNAYNGLEPYFVKQGFTYKLMPLIQEEPETDSAGKAVPRATPILTDKTYSLLTSVFSSGGMEKKGMYIDETTAMMFHPVTELYLETAAFLLKEGKNEKAGNVMKKLVKDYPPDNFPYDSDITQVVHLLYATGETKMADETAKKEFELRLDEYLYFRQMDEPFYKRNENTRLIDYYIVHELKDIVTLFGREKLSKYFEGKLKA